MNKRQKDMVERGIAEIRALRHRNEILEAKVSVMELFATVLNTQPARQSYGAGVDVAWEMEVMLTDLKKEPSSND